MLEYTERPATIDANGVTHQILTALAALEEKNIAHAYWKSSRRLPQVLRGESDYDLLVMPGERRRWTSTLEALGFCSFKPRPGRHLDLMAHMIAPSFDDDVGFARLHFHEAPISGACGVWPYSLGDAEDLLRTRERDETGVLRLGAETEAILLILRYFTERKWRLHSKGPLTERGRADLDYVWRKSDAKKLHQRALEMVSRPLADRLLDIHQRGGSPTNLRELKKLREAVENALPHLRRTSRLRQMSASSRENLSYYSRALYLKAGAQKIHEWPQRRLHAESKGLFVSVVGPDGAGKSTLIDALNDWLSNVMDTEVIYLGKGSIVSALWMGLARVKKWGLDALTAKSNSEPKKQKAAEHTLEAQQTPWRQRLWEAARATQALRQWRKTKQACRRRDQGLIVLADRFPHYRELHGSGPAIQCDENSPLFTRLAASMERKILGNIAFKNSPDLILRLDIDAEEAHRRKPDHSFHALQNKVEALRELDYPNATLCTIDARQPLEEVQRQARRLIWEHLLHHSPRNLRVHPPIAVSSSPRFREFFQALIGC